MIKKVIGVKAFSKEATLLELLERTKGIRKVPQPPCVEALLNIFFAHERGHAHGVVHLMSKETKEQLLKSQTYLIEDMLREFKEETEQYLGRTLTVEEEVQLKQELGKYVDSSKEDESVLVALLRKDNLLPSVKEGLELESMKVWCDDASEENGDSADINWSRLSLEPAQKIFEYVFETELICKSLKLDELEDEEFEVVGRDKASDDDEFVAVDKTVKREALELSDGQVRACLKELMKRESMGKLQDKLKNIIYERLYEKLLIATNTQTEEVLSCLSTEQRRGMMLQNLNGFLGNKDLIVSTKIQIKCLEGLLESEKLDYIISVIERSEEQKNRYKAAGLLQWISRKSLIQKMKELQAEVPQKEEALKILAGSFFHINAQKETLELKHAVLESNEELDTIKSSLGKELFKSEVNRYLKGLIQVFEKMAFQEKVKILNDLLEDNKEGVEELWLYLTAREKGELETLSTAKGSLKEKIEERKTANRLQEKVATEAKEAVLRQLKEKGKELERAAKEHKREEIRVAREADRKLKQEMRGKEKEAVAAQKRAEGKRLSEEKRQAEKERAAKLRQEKEAESLLEIQKEQEAEERAALEKRKLEAVAKRKSEAKIKEDQRRVEEELAEIERQKAAFCKKDLEEKKEGSTVKSEKELLTDVLNTLISYAEEANSKVKSTLNALAREASRLMREWDEYQAEEKRKTREVRGNLFRTKYQRLLTEFQSVMSKSKKTTKLE